MNLRAIALCCFVIFLGCTTEGQEDVVQTKYGSVRGLLFPNYRRFQGVPYATPPLGKLRWKKPIPPSPWTTVKDCRNFNIGCAQSGHSMDVPTNVSEDCLYMEIWTPRAGKYQQKAAVMLFFYGGDFKEGGESFAIYDGAYMASTTNTILVVTDYRVGNLGFLYTGKTDANVGIEDQRFSLQWVQDNVAAFGGDPTKVTIFGQSAGGESVLIHMSSPGVKAAKQFTGAIVESGPMALNFKEPDAALLLAEVFAYELGCGLEDLDCMQNQSTASVLKAAGSSFIVPLDVSEAIMQWAPTVTQDVNFPQEPLSAFQAGEIVQVPFMIGSNSGDGILFGYAIADYIPSYEYVAIVTGIFQDIDITTILEYYPPVWTGDNRNVTSLMLNDYMFLCASRQTVRLAEEAGIKSTYYYQFSRLAPFCPWPVRQKFCCNYVCHGDEMAYLFHDSGAPFPWNFTGIDESLAEAMSNYWAGFAVGGDPNVYNQPGIPKWPIYRTATDINMQLDWPLQSVSNLNKANCDMWDEVGYYHLNRVAPTLHKVLQKRLPKRR